MEIDNFVFYHIYLYDKVNFMVNEQLNKLIDSDLMNHSKLFVLIMDNYNEKFKLDNINTKMIEKYSYSIFYENKNFYEIITQKKMYDYAKLNPGNYLYMHTKGITRINDSNHNNNYSYRNVENWRHLQEHFTIDHWKLCNEYLFNYDLVGSNYMKIDYISNIPAHYSGGFWWTTSKFLQKLPDPQSYLDETNINRFNAEFWIGRIKHHALCLFPLPEKMEEHHRVFVYTDKTDYYNNIKKSDFYN